MVSPSHGGGLGGAGRRSLLAGGTVEGVAEMLGIHDDAVRATFRDVASSSDLPERTSEALRVLADGRTCVEAAKELGISEDDVTAALEELLPSPPARWLGRALQASAVLRVDAPPPVFPARRSPISGPIAGFPGSRAVADQQMVPGRFPEPLYRRLKEWCADNGFSMPVVVRGLVERFLEEQDQRAA